MKNHVFRIDKFVVPEASLEEFMFQVRATHKLLRALPGFVEDFVVKKIGGPGDFNIVTTVIWEDQAAIENAKRRVHEEQSKRQFDPQEFWSRLNITADLGNYSRIEA